ncbi:30S ribosomal protein S20 [Candidatus Bipolaricaulota bacterium]|nr:30S ribosomal protein S20 [Candidatus Bipolaricaulota bacterium]MCF7889692.1 30S ribosomal protein S20 [Candidatus Bipolaricaulota bacterium]
MPIIKSAKKRLRQNKKRRERNKERKKKLKEITKEMNGLLEKEDEEGARELLPELMRAADRAASKGPLHQNKASRIKSKYARRVDDLG